MNSKALLDSAGPRMDKALEHLAEELKTIRTGRAQTALVEGIVVDLYGQHMPIKQIATINTPDVHTIAITPWDPEALVAIEKTIRESQSLGLSPSNDGRVIRLNVPPLTEDRRRELVKTMGEKVEGAHIAMRNIRREILDEARKLEKSKEATEDELRYVEAELNKKIEQYRVKTDTIRAAKETEIMAV